MAKFFKRGNAWYITYYQNGKRLRKSLGKDEANAKLVFKELDYRLSKRERIHSENILLDLFKKEFLEFVKIRQSQKTYYNYKIVLAHFEKFLNEKEGVKYLKDIDMGVIDRYISFRLNSPSRKNRGSNVARSTVNTELKLIKSFFNRARELKYVLESPAKNVKPLSVVKKNPRFFNEDEVVCILEDCADEWIKEIYLMLLYTGMRIGELANLEWDDIDLEGRKVCVRSKDFWRPKGLEERSIPMHNVIYYMLMNKEQRNTWVFIKADGEKINIHSLDTRFMRQLRRIGIQNASLHTWRHTFASYLMMSSGNIRAVQLLLGHKSIKTTEIYSHLSDAHLHHVIQQLPGPNLGTVLGTPLVLLGQ